MLSVQRPAVMVGVHIRNLPGSSPIGSTSAGGGETQCFLCRRILVSQGRINIASITITIVSAHRSSFLANYAKPDCIIQFIIN